MNAISYDSIPSRAGWHAGFLDMLPAVQDLARFRFRRLGTERREDAVQEAIAAACVTYKAAVINGRLHAVRPSRLADFAIRHVREGRHVGSRHETVNDAMSPNCHKRRSVKVTPIRFGYSTDGSDGWKQVAIEDRKVPIPDLAAFRIDFADWLHTLDLRDRRIIRALVRGDRAGEVAAAFDITDGRVSQLRRKFEREWNAIQGAAA